jgi:hypothetical protein
MGISSACRHCNYEEQLREAIEIIKRPFWRFNINYSLTGFRTLSGLFNCKKGKEAGRLPIL